MNRTPFATLTRHFIAVILAPPLLTELGADYLRRTLASLVGMLLLAGVFLPSGFFKKYVDLTAEIRPDNFERALQSDTVLMIAIPMLIVGLLAVVMSPMLFLDETDYQVLTPLPVTRLQIFGARLCALAVVVVVGILAINAITSVWFPFVSGGRRAHHPLFLRIVAHGLAATAGSGWVVITVMAIQGWCLLLAPARWRRVVSVTVQGLVFLGLLLALPFVFRLPLVEITPRAIETTALGWLPPVWFYNLERWLLTASVSEGARARIAVIALAAAATLVVVSCGWLYRSAERLAGFSGAARSGGSRGFDVLGWAQRRQLVAPETSAVLVFSILGVLRSRLHQIVLLLIAGVGLALLIAQLMTVSDDLAFATSRPPTVVHAALAAPLLVGLSITIALRTVFLLPLDRDASWMVRLTEVPARRAAALDGVAHVLRCAAVVPAIVTALALQPWALGARAVPAAALTLLAVLVLVEGVLLDWARVPYTCSYLPGKRVMAYTLGVLFAAYAVFVYLGAQSIRWGALHPSRTLVVGGLLVATFAALRRARMRTWGVHPLEFEDVDPAAPQALGLLPDER